MKELKVIVTRKPDSCRTCEYGGLGIVCKVNCPGNKYIYANCAKCKEERGAIIRENCPSVDSATVCDFYEKADGDNNGD